MDQSASLFPKVDRLELLALHTQEVYKWGASRQKTMKWKKHHLVDYLREDTIQDAHQRQELEEIADLNKNIDISGVEVDLIYDKVVHYVNGLLDEEYYRKGIAQFNLSEITDLLWSDLSSQKVSVSREQFRVLFRTCRINALLASSKSTLSHDIHCYYLHYETSNAISLTTTTDYRSVMQDLCRSLLVNLKSDYVSNFRFIHFEGWNEELVQLLGAVMNLDLDTILDIVPENTSIETTSFDSYVHITLPWVFVDRTVLKRSILHVLLFKRTNIIISIQEQTKRETMGSLKEEITLPLNMVSVISTMRRFHFRYHSNVAVLFYLFDLHVDHIVDIVLHILRHLNQVEDRIVLNDKNGRYFSIDWLKQYSIHNISDYYTILKKIIRISDKLTAAISTIRNLVDNLTDSYFNDIRRSELNYSIRDIQDHLAAVKWYANEGVKLFHKISDKYEVMNKKRSATFFYIVTSFQSVFLPLQTITAIYGMNFEHFPELHYKYSYLIFWVVSILFMILVTIWITR